MIQLDKSLRHLEYCFNTADTEILQKSQQKAMNKVYMFVGLFLCVIAGMFSEMSKTLSENELEMRIKMFGTKYPGRILPVTIWIPGIDESEMKNFVMIFIWELYMGFVFLLTGVGLIPLLPMLVVHVQGQVQILCKYIQMLGSPHTDAEGNRIFFIDIMKNKYMFAKNIKGFEEHLIPKCSGNEREMAIIAKKNIWKKKVQKAYEVNFFKQIIKFHLKLLVFVEQFMKMVHPFVVIIRIGNYMIFSLSLYQLTMHPFTPSWTMFRCLSNFAAVLLQYYGFCEASEILDDNHILLRTSLCHSNWYKCSTITRRNIRMFLIRLHKENHLKFYKGMVVFSKPAFVALLRLSYQVVNLMRIQSLRHISR
ncbi:hypothetical protein WDU94_006876 [Cyamophila willieti]